MDSDVNPLRFMSPLRNGLWLIADAAASLAQQEHMGPDGRTHLARLMGQGAKLAVDDPRHLRTRHWGSGLPKDPGEAVGHAICVSPADLNAWLEACGAPYRWQVSISTTRSRADVPAHRETHRRKSSSTPTESSPPLVASTARWAHQVAFKAKAMDLARSKPFDSRAEAAKYAADYLDDKPGGKGKRYDWTTVDTWLKEASWAPEATDE